MALIKCSECGKEFSNKAKACPNCACPIEEIEFEEEQLEEQQNEEEISSKIEETETEEPEIEEPKIVGETTKTRFIKNKKIFVLSIVLLTIATIIPKSNLAYELPLILYVSGFISLAISTFLHEYIVSFVEIFFSGNSLKELEEKETKHKYESLIQEDEKIIMLGEFNKSFQKLVIDLVCFPLYAVSVFFIIMGIIWFFNEEDILILFITIISIVAFVLIKKFKKWCYLMIDEQYLVITNKRVLLKKKWEKYSLIYSKISSISTMNVFFYQNTLRLVVNLGSSVYIPHLNNNEEIVEELLKRID